MNKNDEQDEELTDQQVISSFAPPQDKAARWAGDYSLLLWEIKARLCGGHLDTNDKGMYYIKIPKGAIPFMNDKGIENTLACLNGFVTKVQKYSIFSEERIFQWCKAIDWALCKLYFANMDSYDLTPDKADVVIQMIMSMVEANYRSSIEGQAMIGLSQTEKVIQTNIPQQQSKRWFGVV